MKSFALLSLLALFLGINAVQAGDDELVNLLTNELKITEDQAKGGAGALFNYAKESLSKDDFQKVAGAVPDMSGYLDAIPSLGGESTGMMGKATKNLMGMPAVTKAFEKLGLGQDMVSMFTPLLVKFVDKKGGKAVGDLLQKVFNK